MIISLQNIFKSDELYSRTTSFFFFLFVTDDQESPEWLSHLYSEIDFCFSDVWVRWILPRKSILSQEADNSILTFCNQVVFVYKCIKYVQNENKKDFPNSFDWKDQTFTNISPFIELQILGNGWTLQKTMNQYANKSVILNLPLGMCHCMSKWKIISFERSVKLHCVFFLIQKSSRENLK